MRVLIAYVYNRNGIATWCYEAARALIPHTQWCRVICHNSIKVPADLQDYVIPYHPHNKNRSLFKKIKDRIKHGLQWILPVKPDSMILKQTIKTLELKGEAPPDIILVCQPNFIAPQINIPQWVVARTFPTTASGYFSQMTYPSDSAFLKRLHFFWYWYRMDNKGYRLSGRVLALSDALAIQISRKGILAKRVYPGVTGNLNFTPQKKEGPIRLITAALHLEEKRKNIAWLLQAVSPLNNAAITLAGDYSNSFYQKVTKEFKASVSFSGFVNRSQLLEIFSDQELFLFASHQENWGYVLVEAMAFGCAVFAPNQYPFNEIIGRKDYLYTPGNTQDFKEKLLALINNRQKLFEDRLWFFQRYQQLFSGNAFSSQILKVIQPLQ